MEFCKVIPFDKIEKIACVKSNGKYEALSSVKKRTGADIVINGPMFDMVSYSICQSFICNGIERGYTDGKYGFRFDDNTASLSKGGSGAQHYISEFGMLVMNGEIKCTVSASANTRRGRTAIGYTENNELVIYVVTDGEKYASKKTGKELAKKMLSLGCRHAINLDGGGSSQVADNTGIYASGRYVPGFVAVWLKKDENKQEDKDKMTVLATTKVYTYDVKGNKECNRYIAKNDVCTITRTITENLLIEIEYPVSSGKRTAYIKTLDGFKVV